MVCKSSTTGGREERRTEKQKGGFVDYKRKGATKGKGDRAGVT